jgi:lipopolysaccharide transport system permease protein
MEKWDKEITPKKSLFDLNLHQIWKFKDLLFLFVWRDFVSVYKQTILGPLWFFIQPILTSITFTIIFGNFAQISTDGMPKLIFYMAGITMWNYFADCLNKTSNTFVANQGLFGKVYFPRLIVPLSIIVTNLLKFGIQIILFMGFWTYFCLTTESLEPNLYILAFPLLVLIMAALGLGFGMVISALTTKYRDLAFLIGFGVQLLMYGSPIIYPMSTVPEKHQWIIKLNPMTSIIDTFKHAFMGTGSFDGYNLLYSCIFAVCILFLGLVVFNKVEKSFIDTV